MTILLFISNFLNKFVPDTDWVCSTGGYMIESVKANWCRGAPGRLGGASSPHRGGESSDTEAIGATMRYCSGSPFSSFTPTLPLPHKLVVVLWNPRTSRLPRQVADIVD
jgi:hypothetical protein